MSETDVTEKLSDVREELAELQASLRVAARVRIVGAAVAVAIAVGYAFAFLGLAEGLGGDGGEVAAAIRLEWQNKQTRDAAYRAGETLLTEVAPVYLGELRTKAEEIDLAPALAGQTVAFVGDVISRLAPAAWRTVAELDMEQEFADELGNLVADVGPVYYNGAREAMRAEHIVQAYVEALEEVGAAVGPTVLDELNRVAPDVLAEVTVRRDQFAGEVARAVENQAKVALERALVRKEDRIRTEARLTETAAREKLARAVVAADAAVRALAQKRQWSIQDEMTQMQAFLDRVPEASEKDPDKLLAEIGRASVGLLRLRLPPGPVGLEWAAGAEGGAQ